MSVQLIAALIAGGAVLGIVVWVLAKIGRALITIAEALAAAAAMFFVLWLLIKGVVWALRQAFTRWRTSLAVIGVLAWSQWWGWLSLAITTGVAAGVLTGWRLLDVSSFDAWAGRHLRLWWLRWTIYAPKLPEWLHACGLCTRGDTAPMVVALVPLGRSFRRRRRRSEAVLPRVLGVRSGASWDEVRVRLIPGQKPEDVDQAARALASARGVARCQVRELFRTSSRSTFSAATCSPIPWPVPPSLRVLQGSQLTCGGCGPGAPSTAWTGTCRWPVRPATA
jgi:DNA segregation ATPase FtsK/SpoIIIE, S-DNA-T family